MNSKILRPYQARLVTDACRAAGDVLIEQPTGSGKTMQIVALVAMQLGRRFTHAVIAAPQEQIEHGFVHRDHHRVEWPLHAGVAVPAVAVPEEIIWGARHSQLGSVKRLLAYLRQPAPVEHALACTHAALNKLSAADLPDDLSGKALFLDEAHHASADGLSQLVAVWRERGGQLVFVTATPYRGDGRPVALDGMRLLRRSLAEHMAEGFAPGHLDSEIVALGNPGDVLTPAQFTGEDAPPPSYFDGLVQAIRRKWLDDGKPKAIVRVPPMKGGKSGELVRRLTEALAAEKARILDATGTETLDKQRFLAGLQAEQQQTFATSTFDVMIGIQRVLEGTDWPLCSAVYCVGMPGSLNTVVQFLGRAMRLKPADYPAEQRDRARLVFVVPCGGGAALADLSIDHSRHALLTCCFLADHEVGQEWIALREVRRGIADALGPREENPAAADAENEADAPLDPAIRAELELAMASAREQILNAGGEPTLGEVVQLAAKTRPDLPAAALHRVAAEILAAQPGPVGAEAREAIHTEIARRLRIDPMVKRAMEEAFGVVLNEFRDATLEQSAVLESVRRQVHGVTGGQMRAFAERLRAAIPKPLTEAQILAWADLHQERTNKWPLIDSGALADAPGETWANIDAALRAGTRGLPGGSSLPQLLAALRGARNIQDLCPLTESQILAWADSHLKRTKEWPTRESGPVLDCPDETWTNINQALKLGLRSLPSGSSLAQLLAEKRAVRNHKRLDRLSLEQILEWADAHYQVIGEWPSNGSGPILNTAGETWANINAALTQGGRGFAGGSSLLKLLAEKRGVRNRPAPPLLTKEQILSWVDSHREVIKDWPSRSSGPIAEALGETWGAVDDALKRGSRGLPGDSSLAHLLAEARGVRKRMDSELTKEQVLKWADAHHQHFGVWPKTDSGAVCGAPDEKWANINASLFQGGRGLPGGSSLAQLLHSERGVRNSGALPLLTNDQILLWADAHFERTGQWPRVKSGTIPDAPGEIWHKMDSALRIGLRGLTGGSSLARLIQEHRGTSLP